MAFRLASMSALAALVVAAIAVPASATELTVFSGGAVKSGLVAAAELYQAQKGVKLTIEFHPMGPLTQKLAEGATPDLVILTDETVEGVAAKGLIARDTATEAGRVAIGVAVNEKAASPDISTPEAFKQAVLNAKSLVYIDPTRGTSGKHLAGVFERLGITEAIKSKTTLGSGGYVVEPVGRGEIELGIHQITEILPVKGVKLVGPLPAALQKETVYIGFASTATKQRDIAKDFLAFLRTPDVRKKFAEAGFIERR
jgi:molybdate transport system substrate-binding protein